MTWFPQSWWNYVRLETAVGGLQSPVLMGLMVFSNIASEIGQGKRCQSVCWRAARLRKGLYTFSYPLYKPATCLTWPCHWHYNNAQLKVETDLISEFELYLLFVTHPTWKSNSFRQTRSCFSCSLIYMNKRCRCQIFLIVWTRLNCSWSRFGVHRHFPFRSNRHAVNQGWLYRQ